MRIGILLQVIFACSFCCPLAQAQQVKIAPCWQQKLGFKNKTIGCSGLEQLIPGRKVIVKQASAKQLQKVLDSVAALGGGTVVLHAAEYIIDTTLNIPSYIRLMGTGRMQVKLVGTMQAIWLKDNINTGILLFNGTINSAVENLSIIYKASSKLPIEKPNFSDHWDSTVFTNNPDADDKLYVSGIVLEGAKNCKISHCSILNSGTDPIFVQHSEHVTFSYNLVDHCYNKGGDGNGYYVLRKQSAYNLVYADTVKRIRHFTLEIGAHHNVVTKCYFEVDVNFHNGDKGYNVIQDNEIKIPNWHGWACFSAGVKNFHAAPGPMNVLFRNHCYYRTEMPAFNNATTGYLFSHAEKLEKIAIPEPIVRFVNR